MIKNLLIFITRAVVLLALQLLVLNNIQLGGYLNPYLYILIITLLPINFPGWLLLLISFITGLIIDQFSITPGMHTMACVAMGYFRIHLLSYMAPREGYENQTNISTKEMGFSWYLRYTLLLTTIHHTILFLVESFSLQNLPHILVRIILSIAFTQLLIVIFEYFRTTRFVTRSNT